MTDFIPLWRVSPKESVVWVITFLVTLLTTTQYGILAALGTSVLALFSDISRPATSILGKLGGTRLYRNIERYPSARQPDDVLIFRFDARLHFANQEFFEESIEKAIKERYGEKRAPAHGAEASDRSKQLRRHIEAKLSPKGRPMSASPSASDAASAGAPQVVVADSDSKLLHPVTRQASSSQSHHAYGTIDMRGDGAGAGAGAPAGADASLLGTPGPAGGGDVMLSILSPTEPMPPALPSSSSGVEDGEQSGRARELPTRRNSPSLGRQHSGPSGRSHGSEDGAADDAHHSQHAHRHGGAGLAKHKQLSQDQVNQRLDALAAVRWPKDVPAELKLAVIISSAGINSIDSSSLEMLKRLFARKDILLIFAGLKGRVARKLIGHSGIKGIETLIFHDLVDAVHFGRACVRMHRRRREAEAALKAANDVVTASSSFKSAEAAAQIPPV